MQTDDSSVLQLRGKPRARRYGLDDGASTPRALSARPIMSVQSPDAASPILAPDHGFFSYSTGSGWSGYEGHSRREQVVYVGGQ